MDSDASKRSLQDFGTKMLQPVGKIVEIGYVVENLEDGARHFSESLGAGPFTYYRGIVMRNARYRGCHTAVEIDIAMGASGGVVIELVQPRNEAPSPFHRPTPGALGCLNHLSVFTPSLDEELARYRALGIEAIFSAEFESADGASAARVVYLDTVGQFGSYLELMETSPSVLLDLYTGIAAAAR